MAQLKNFLKIHKTNESLKSGYQKEEEKMRLKQLRISQAIQQKELAKLVGVDEPMMSKFENFKCLPTPSIMSSLCKSLSCSVKDIYDTSEISYVIQGKKSTTTTENEVYHLTVNLPREAREFFRTQLKECGYRDITDWVNQCYKRLLRKHEKLQQKKTSFPPASKNGA